MIGRDPSSASRRHARLGELFERARAGRAEEALAEARREDGSLAQELEELLEAWRRCGGFLERPVLGPEAAHAILDERREPAGMGELAPEELGELGPFRPIDVLGRGGGAVVYRAWQRSPSRLVALKVLDATLADERARRRFEDEAQILARLAHPGIAQVHEAGTASVGGRLLAWFAMELVEGAVDLRTWCEARALSLRERVTLLAAVCDAVHHAHQRGVVHRDLKPHNVLVDREGRPRVIDFGVARLMDGDPLHVTRTGDSRAILGTLAYMSPEQCAGQGDAIDLRCDVWSLGAMLFELCCGRRPFALAGLSLPAALRLVAESEPPAPRALRSDLPLELEAILLQALRREPAKRYGSVSELAADLRRFLAGEPVLARPPGPLERLLRLARRRPVAATGVASLCVAGLVLASTWLTVRWLALAPRHLELHPDRAGVSLVSRLGQRLFTVEGGRADAIQEARLVPLPARLGGGEALLVAFGSDAHPPQLAGELRLIRARAPYTTLWRSQAEPLALPAEPPPGVTGRFLTSALLVADFLPELEGLEIASTHSFDPFSPTAIRVWDLEGRVRYEVWHDGAVGSLSWLEGARVLVGAGLNSEKRWDQRGACHPGATRARFASVAFGLAPRLDHRSCAWLVEGGSRRDESLRWYRWLGPVREALILGETGARLDLATGELDPRTHVRISWIAARDESSPVDAGLHLVLDAEGRESARWTDDGWKLRHAAGLLVDASALRLCEYEELPH